MLLLPSQSRFWTTKTTTTTNGVTCNFGPIIKDLLSRIFRISGAIVLRLKKVFEHQCVGRLACVPTHLISVVGRNLLQAVQNRLAIVLSAEHKILLRVDNCVEICEPTRQRVGRRRHFGAQKTQNIVDFKTSHIWNCEIC